jgi:hypothetical protein
MNGETDRKTYTTNIQTDKLADKSTVKQRYNERQTERERQTNIQTDRQMNTVAEKKVERLTKKKVVKVDWHMHKRKKSMNTTDEQMNIRKNTAVEQMGKYYQKDEQSDRETDKQANRQTD